MRSLRLPVFPSSLYLAQTHPVASIPVSDSHQHGPHSRTLTLWPDLLTYLEYDLSNRSLHDADVGVCRLQPTTLRLIRVPTQILVLHEVYEV